MRKITVKHYLNNRLKPDNSNDRYRVYIRIVYQRETHCIKSEVVGMYLATETEFYTNSQIKLDVEYETELINSFIRFVEKYKEDFKISDIKVTLADCLEWYNNPIIFKDGYFDRIEKDVLVSQRNSIINFLCEKSNLSPDLIAPLIINFREFWDFVDCGNLEYFEKNKILSDDLLKKLKFFSLLSNYQNIKFNNIGQTWGANMNFNLLEWYDRDGKEKFINFAIKSKILNEVEIRDFANEIDKKANEKISGFWYSYNRKYKTK